MVSVTPDNVSVRSPPPSLPIPTSPNPPISPNPLSHPPGVGPKGQKKKGRQMNLGGVRKRTNKHPHQLHQRADELRRCVLVQGEGFGVDCFSDREPEGGFETLDFWCVRWGCFLGGGWEVCGGVEAGRGCGVCGMRGVCGGEGDFCYFLKVRLFWAGCHFH